MGTYLVLVGGATAHTDPANMRRAGHDRQPAGKSNDAGYLSDTRQSSSLMVLAIGELFYGAGWEWEFRLGFRFMSRDIAAAQVGAVHALEGDGICAGIDDGDVHLPAFLLRLCLASHDDLFGKLKRERRRIVQGHGG